MYLNRRKLGLGLGLGESMKEFNYSSVLFENILTWNRRREKGKSSAVRPSVGWSEGLMTTRANSDRFKSLRYTECSGAWRERPPPSIAGVIYLHFIITVNEIFLCAVAQLDTVAGKHSRTTRNIIFTWYVPTALKPFVAGLLSLSELNLWNLVLE